MVVCRYTWMQQKLFWVFKIKNNIQMPLQNESQNDHIEVYTFYACNMSTKIK